MYTWPSSVYYLYKSFAKLFQTSTPRMFADDTSLTAVGKTLNEAERRDSE
jgi:hypothetical protein